LASFNLYLTIALGRYAKKTIVIYASMRKKMEAFARVCDYNLKRLCYLKYLKNISAVDTWDA
jgi:hypothetical protein